MKAVVEMRSIKGRLPRKCLQVGQYRRGTDRNMYEILRGRKKRMMCFVVARAFPSVDGGVARDAALNKGNPEST